MDVNINLYFCVNTFKIDDGSLGKFDNIMGKRGMETILEVVMAKR